MESRTKEIVPGVVGKVSCSLVTLDSISFNPENSEDDGTRHFFALGADDSRALLLSAETK